MALIGNYTSLSQTPGRSYGGGASGVGMDRSDFNKSSSARNFYFGWAGVSSRDSYPLGLNPGSGSWLVAYREGGISSTMRITSTGIMGDANLAGGKDGLAESAGAGVIAQALGQLVLSAIATLAGSGIISSDILGRLQAGSDLVGVGSFTQADIQALASAVAPLVGSGLLSNASPSARGALTAALLPFTDLSPQSLAAAVWSTDMKPGGSPTYSVPGTAGAILTMLHWMQNGRMITDPTTGQMRVYNDDGDIVGTFDIFEDAAGTVPYSGNGVEYREARA